MHSTRSGQPDSLRTNHSRAVSSSQAGSQLSVSTTPSASTTDLETASNLAQREIELINDWAQKHLPQTETSAGHQPVSSLLKIGDTADWDAQAQLRSEEVLQTLFRVAMRFNESPLGSHEDDHHVLVEALRSHEDGRSYLAILNDMHGVNNHSSSQWKDHFLDHHDELLATLHGSSLDVSVLSDDEVEEYPAHREENAKRASRSRSITPPVPVPYVAGRHRFTEDDREYLIRMGQNMRRQDPNVTLQAICDVVAEKAPYHTSKSWRSFLSTNSRIRDEILNVATHSADHRPDIGSAVPEEYNSDRDHDQDLSERPPDLDGAEDLKPRDDDANDTDDLELWLSERPGDAAEDVRNLGRLGEPYNEADDRTLARYMASDSGWYDRSLGESIKLFYAKYKTRSPAAWIEHYRNNEMQLEELASQFRLHYAREQKQHMKDETPTEDLKSPKRLKRASPPLRQRRSIPTFIEPEPSSSSIVSSLRSRRQQPYGSEYRTHTYGATRNTKRHSTHTNGTSMNLNGVPRTVSKQKSRYRERNANEAVRYELDKESVSTPGGPRTKSVQKRRREAYDIDDEDRARKNNGMKRLKITEQGFEPTGTTLTSVVNQIGSWFSDFWEG